jgi:hypothetical protein
MRNKSKPVRLIPLLLTAILLFSAQISPPASAAATHEFFLYEGEEEFHIYIDVADETPAYAGIEFGLKLSSESALKFISYDQRQGTPVYGSATTPFVTVGGIHYFGFYQRSNAFSDDITVGPLKFTYTGAEAQTITMTHMQVARISYSRPIGQKNDSTVGVYTIRRAPGERPAGLEEENGIPTFHVTVGGDGGPSNGGKLRSSYFDDVTERWAWAVNEIDYLYELGVVKGTGGRMYTPAANIQRGDFMLMLARAYQLEGDFDDNFADVPADSYFYEAIGIAKALGIAKGVGGDRFAPNDPITRQDMMALVERTLRAIGNPLPEGGDADLAPFPDRDTIYDYAVLPAATLVKSGIIKGTNLGLLNPLGYTTRAEMAVVVCRLLLLE